MKLHGVVPNFHIQEGICKRFIYSHGRFANFAKLEFENWEQGRAVSFPGYMNGILFAVNEN